MTDTNRYPLLLLSAILILIAANQAAILPSAEQTLGVTITVDCDGVPHVRIEMPADTGLIKISAPVDVYPGTLEARIDNVSVPAVYDNGTIYVAVDNPGNLVVTYVGVTELSPEGELYFRLNTAGVQIVMSNCTILTNIPQNLADAQSSDNGTLLLKLSGPDEVRYLPVSLATPVQQPPTAQQPNTTTVTIEEEYTATSPAGEQQEITQTYTEVEDETPKESPSTQTSETKMQTTAQELQPKETGSGLPSTALAALAAIIIVIVVALAVKRNN